MRACRFVSNAAIPRMKLGRATAKAKAPRRGTTFRVSGEGPRCTCVHLHPFACVPAPIAGAERADKNVLYEAAVQLQSSHRELGAPRTWPQVLLCPPQYVAFAQHSVTVTAFVEAFRHVTDRLSICCLQDTRGSSTGQALLPACTTHKQEAALRQGAGCKCETYTSLQH